MTPQPPLALNVSVVLCVSGGARVHDGGGGGFRLFLFSPSSCPLHASARPVPLLATAPGPLPTVGPLPDLGPPYHYRPPTITLEAPFTLRVGQAWTAALGGSHAWHSMESLW